MSWSPEPPADRHVWVRGFGEHGAPRAGVVVSWQHTPVHQASGPEWSALVVEVAFGAALLVDWVSADRLLPLRDPSARDRPERAADGVARRHAWIDGGAGQWHPGLVLEWRRTAQRTWEAHAAAVRRHSVLLTWTAADRLRPVADDRWLTRE